MVDHGESIVAKHEISLEDKQPDVPGLGSREFSPQISQQYGVK